MHEMLHWLLQQSVRAASEPGQVDSGGGGTNNKDVVVVIVSTFGTLAGIGLTAWIASFKRQKSPDSTVESIRNNETVRQNKLVDENLNQLRSDLQEAREDLDISNRDKDHWHDMYNRLREAVWRHKLNPDTIMNEVGDDPV